MKVQIVVTANADPQSAREYLDDEFGLNFAENPGGDIEAVATYFGAVLSSNMQYDKVGRILSGPTVTRES